ncbi:hypothetical protein ANANG_G00071960, partial [Anguilla anguilla]
RPAAPGPRRPAGARRGPSAGAPASGPPAGRRRPTGAPACCTAAGSSWGSACPGRSAPGRPAAPGAAGRATGGLGRAQVGGGSRSQAQKSSAQVVGAEPGAGRESSRAMTALAAWKACAMGARTSSAAPRCARRPAATRGRAAPQRRAAGQQVEAADGLLLRDLAVPEVVGGQPALRHGGPAAEGHHGQQVVEHAAAPAVRISVVRGPLRSTRSGTGVPRCGLLRSSATARPTTPQNQSATSSGEK